MAEADPLDGVRTYLAAGGSLRELARRAGVPHNTIHNWLTRGTPTPLIQGLKVIAAIKPKPAKRRRTSP